MPPWSSGYSPLTLLCKCVHVSMLSSIAARQCVCRGLSWVGLAGRDSCAVSRTRVLCDGLLTRSGSRCAALRGVASQKAGM